MLYENIILLAKQSMNNLKLHRCGSTMSKALKYCQFGEPVDVLKLTQYEVEDPIGKQVLVKILAAPINPADINTIQGKYPVKPKFPAVGGNEGVGEVQSVGDKVSNLRIGERVILLASGQGSWRTHALFNEEQLLSISSKITVAEAATLTVNPCTAYRMLKDFVKLSPGDTVIQNGANSAVGQAVHQLCQAWGINSVGIVRNRASICELKDELKCIGATEVYTEEEIRTATIFKDGTLDKPKLALNCVGGKSATEVSRHLQDKGVLVTYGGMSREPVTVPTAQLIFKDIAFHGYWMTRWTKENANTEEQKKMFDELSKLIEEGKFKAPPHELVPLENFRNASDGLGLKGYGGKKYIFHMINC